jgi:hypothetical protein
MANKQNVNRCHRRGTTFLIAHGTKAKLTELSHVCQRTSIDLKNREIESLTSRCAVLQLRYVSRACYSTSRGAV